MDKKKMPLNRKAWNLLRLAFLWTRKGGVFKDLRPFPSYIKSLCHNSTHRRDSIRCRERELSFDDTPIFHLKMNRPASMRFLMPCLNTPSVDFDYDFEEDLLNNTNPDDCILGSPREEVEEQFDHGRCSSAMVSYREEDNQQGGAIDVKAEEFIAQFYQQIKLQRQISYLQYQDMINRGAS